MERETRLNEISNLMGKNFIGYNELKYIVNEFPLNLNVNIPEIPFTDTELKEKKDNYILILGMSELIDGQALNLINLRDVFGFDPQISEPCFYNQDWYVNEAFVTKTLENRWYLIKKHIFDESRGISPDILKKDLNFPSAILCAYTFFAYWFVRSEFLWQYDFVWCDDKDHNGDIIYVGKYTDIDGVNKNGFSVHRHLAIRNFYGAVESL